MTSSVVEEDAAAAGFQLYNEKEKEVLVQFRKEVELFSTNLHDHFLIRWLRARNLDLKKAKEMLQNYYDWKNTNTLLPPDFESTTTTTTDDWIAPQIIVNDFKYKFLGLDNSGRPVLWMPIGRWEVRKRLEEGLKDDAFRYAYRIMSLIQKQIETQRTVSNGLVHQFIGLLDCNELTFRKLSIETIQCTLRFFREFEAYYPETICACYVINAPMVFSFVFNLVKPLMSSHTLSKIHVFDFNQAKWNPTLSDAIPLEILPIEYGGSGDKVLTTFS